MFQQDIWLPIIKATFTVFLTIGIAVWLSSGELNLSDIGVGNFQKVLTEKRKYVISQILFGPC